MKIERSSEPELFFSKKEKQRIIGAIQEAEKKTSGEIRVHLERKARPDFMEHAREIFQKIGMTATKDRNGVLILLGVKTKRFAVLGDTGINQRVPENFWNGIAGRMSQSFKEDQFADGIVAAVQTIGERLAEHFPYNRADINELPDEISCSY